MFIELTTVNGEKKHLVNPLWIAEIIEQQETKKSRICFGMQSDYFYDVKETPEEIKNMVDYEIGRIGQAITQNIGNTISYDIVSAIDRNRR